MDDTDVRLWLVERTYTDKGLVTLVYATTDGERRLQQQRSMNMLQQVDVTAGIDADPESLEAVDDEEVRERYADEAREMANRYDPDDAV
ncbi:hypothetical protein [Halorussus halophilus]|uniref:hypothetical protein n=1 Tax=Halorussus halophilus TaxID=2650975 RepID=UPI001301814E|nr:hypothetical protein [Halorussus halophilus]